MPVMPDKFTKAKAILGQHIRPLSFTKESYMPLLESLKDAQVVLIGDASHGTYEFYAHRANLTERLVTEKGFTCVAIEADWPDAWRVNRYIRGMRMGDGDIKSPQDSLKDFERFPKWMWKNEVMPPFIEHLKKHNVRVRDPSHKVSFYGMDLYSLHRSGQAVIKYLQEVDPKAAEEAKRRYNCFERFGEDTSQYALASQFGLTKECSAEVLQVLQKLTRNHNRYVEELLARDREADAAHLTHENEKQFVAEMNALVVKDAEEYYRSMIYEDVKTWNLRDDHFARVLVHIRKHLGVRDADGSTKPPKIVVWAHNSHIGDARHTDMGWRRGEINIGQRCREIFGEDNVYNIGFLSDRGTVTAAPNWDEPPRLYTINPPIDQCIENVFDSVSGRDFYLMMYRIESKGHEGAGRKKAIATDVNELLSSRLYQRFIGVIYRPYTEKLSHYSLCSLSNQYDAVAFIKSSRGIMPLEEETTWKGVWKGEVDLTFPFGY